MLRQKFNRIDIWHLTFDILLLTFGPIDQQTNGSTDQWINGPMDKWTNGPKDQSQRPVTFKTFEQNDEET